MPYPTQRQFNNMRSIAGYNPADRGRAQERNQDNESGVCKSTVCRTMENDSAARKQCSVIILHSLKHQLH